MASIAGTTSVITTLPNLGLVSRLRQFSQLNTRRTPHRRRRGFVCDVFFVTQSDPFPSPHPVAAKELQHRNGQQKINKVEKIGVSPRSRQAALGDEAFIIVLCRSCRISIADDRKPALRSVIAARVFAKSRVERAKRSNLVTISTSPASS